MDQFGNDQYESQDQYGEDPNQQNFFRNLGKQQQTFNDPSDNTNNNNNGQPPPAANGQPPPAVDYSDWNTPATNPSGTPMGHPANMQSIGASNFDYGGARDSWMSGRYSKDEAGAAQWARDFGIQYNGGDTISLPNGGGMIDILGNWAGGKGNGQAVTQNWTPAGGNGPNPNGVGSGGGPGGIGGGGGGFGGNSALRDELIKTLLERSKQSLNIDASTDPNIRNQVDPFEAAQQRQSRNFLADMAEKHGPGANLTGEARVASEHAGQATAGYQGQLIGQEINSRRQEIQNALTSMQGYLSDQDRLALQQELGHLNDATARLGLSNQYDLGMRNLGLEDWVAQNNDYYRRSGI